MARGHKMSQVFRSIVYLVKGVSGLPITFDCQAFSQVTLDS